MSDIDFGRFDALTFDTYGTLIDWERGILDALQPVLAFHDVDVGEDELLERYARHEARVEAGKYQRYRDVLGLSLRGLCEEIGINPTKGQVAAFSNSVGAWPAFPDSARALLRLATRFRLGVITNCDYDLFAASNLRLGVELDWVVSALIAKAY